MKEMTLDAKLVRAAMQCQGTEDVRGYLNGIFIGKDGTIAASNGHVLFVTKGKHDHPEEDIIIRIHGELSEAITTIKIIPANEELGVVMASSSDLEISGDQIYAYEILPGKFPNVRKAIPTGDLVATEGMMLNPRYINLASKIFGDNVVCEFEFRGKQTAVVVRAPALSFFNDQDWPDDTMFVVMPGKLE